MAFDSRTAAIAEAVLCACRFDVLAPKPGNVGFHASGHGMSSQDFLLAARVSAPFIVDIDRGLGACIDAAVSASVEATGCNTNLGIVLLAAPLARAALLRDSSESLEERLAKLLNETTVADCAAVFRAIRTAKPAGLGRSDEHDVADDPNLNLLEVMRFAAVRDRIAAQYVNEFADIFDTALPCLRDYRERWASMRWACVGLYLRFLSDFPDTHIQRKHGLTIAQTVQDAAGALESAFKACENPATLAKQLAEFDRELKHKGVNPGTSADLTVASVLALLLQHA